MPETGIRYDQHQRIIDGNGMILVTNPSNPATGGYITENQLKDWIGKEVEAYSNASQFPTTGSDGILYIDKSMNVLYRWNGTSYVSVSADTSELEQRVEELEAENAQQAKDIAMLKYANEGRTYIMEESDRDGYTVDVEPATVTGEAFGEAVLKSVEGRDVVVEGQILSNSLTAVRSEGRNLLSVTNWKNTSDYLPEIPVELKKGMTYTFSHKGRGTTLRFPKNDGTYQYVAFAVGHATFTCEENYSSLGAYLTTFTAIDAQIEEGSTATSYTPYRPPVTLPLPSICSTLHGVGTARDKVGFVSDENGKRWLTRKVGMVDLGSLSYSYRNDGSYYAPYLYADVTTLGVKLNGQTTDRQNALCARYPIVERAGLYNADMVYALDGDATRITQIQIKDSRYTDASAFKASLSGVILLYELATPQLLDVTDQVPEEPSIPVEDGGTLTFVNENKVATPSRISMPVKLGGTV